MIMPAKYTEVLKNLMDNEQTKPLIDKALSTYPLYEQKTTGEFIPVHIPTRKELNDAILNYYKYREIGFETVGRFLDELETAMCEIMPYYNQQYFSVDQDYNVLENANYTREIDRERDVDRTNKIEGSERGTSNSQAVSEGSDNTTNTTTTESNATDETSTTTTTTTNNKEVESGTPQGSLSITAQNIDNVPYADKVRWTKDQATQTGTTNGESETTGSSTSNTQANSELETNTTSENEQTNELQSNGSDNEKENTFEHVKGNYGQITYQTLLKQYRDLIQNVTQQIINDKRIAELFMLIY